MVVSGRVYEDKASGETKSSGGSPAPNPQTGTPLSSLPTDYSFSLRHRNLLRLADLLGYDSVQLSDQPTAITASPHPGEIELSLLPVLMTSTTVWPRPADLGPSLQTGRSSF
ncbi:hypothetical protein PoB_003692400 [Plakobranchus ocellatus]|uniref:Uncharacterized protein n=1 Tax=Plakobranchus ocellatus TaxID=259542 RepID=A0AAV4AVM3_9GAST|nr:hypothetical protein PoB_003692400 [Plakobranchus ocellatus]